MGGGGGGGGGGKAGCVVIIGGDGSRADMLWRGMEGCGGVWRGVAGAMPGAVS